LHSLTHAQAALAIQNLRIGSVLDPDELITVLKTLGRHPWMGTYALTAEVPSWLVSQLDPASEQVATIYTVYPSRDGLDRILVITLQCASTQVRITMELSDPKIRLFFRTP